MIHKTFFKGKTITNKKYLSDIDAKDVSNLKDGTKIEVVDEIHDTINDTYDYKNILCQVNTVNGEKCLGVKDNDKRFSLDYLSKTNINYGRHDKYHLLLVNDKSVDQLQIEEKVKTKESKLANEMIKQAFQILNDCLKNQIQLSLKDKVIYAKYGFNLGDVIEETDQIKGYDDMCKAYETKDFRKMNELLHKIFGVVKKDEVFERIDKEILEVNKRLVPNENVELRNHVIRINEIHTIRQMSKFIRNAINHLGYRVSVEKELDFRLTKKATLKEI